MRWSTARCVSMVAVGTCGMRVPFFTEGQDGPRDQCASKDQMPQQFSNFSILSSLRFGVSGGIRGRRTRRPYRRRCPISPRQSPAPLRLQGGGTTSSKAPPLAATSPLYMAITTGRRGAILLQARGEGRWKPS